MVIGDKRPYLTALVVPSFEELKNYARYKHLTFSSHEDLLKSKEIRNLVTRRIHEKIRDSARYEQIQYFMFLPQEFTLERGELTPTLKIRRRVVMERYHGLIEKLYSENPDRIPVND